MQINKINYPENIKRLDLSKRPKKQRWYIQILIFIISALMIIGKKRKIIKINMEGLKKTPYLLLCTHMQFLDFAVAMKAAAPRKVNNVVAIDAFDFKRFLLYPGGCFEKRKFTNEIYTVKNIMYCLKKLKSVACIYPEARYSQLGTTAILPDSLGKMIKMLKVPAVTLVFNGHYLMKPTWGDGKTRKEVPIKATMKQILTQEQAENYSIGEINAILRKEFEYDEYKYWRETGFKITYKNRAQGIHNVLYKCPDCGAEYETASAGAEIKCNKCKSVWELTETGEIKSLTGETRFKYVPDWCEWERAEVKKELESGTYEFTDNPEAVSQPHGKYAIPLGKTNFKHNCEGFNITGNYNGEDFNIVKLPLENYGVQTEFFFPRLKKKHTIGLSADDDTFYFFPTKEGMPQKLYFAVEELYKIKHAAVIADREAAQRLSE